MKYCRAAIVVMCFPILAFITRAQTSSCSLEVLRNEMQAAAATVGGHFGAAASLLESGELVSVRGGDRFPMQSVYKLPIAMAVLQQVDAGKLHLNQKIHINKEDFPPAPIGSPLRDKYPEGDIDLTLQDLLQASIVESDGGASDVLLKLVSPAEINAFLGRIGVTDINVATTEKAMAQDRIVQYQNWATPEGSIRLLKQLKERRRLSLSSQKLIFTWTTDSLPGQNRIKGLLPPGTLVAHKTGTSGTFQGMVAATNDIGIITMPDGKRLAVAVFVSNSTADEQTRESAIAKTARAAWECWNPAAH